MSEGCGCNERLLAQSGFLVCEVREVTESMAPMSRKWRGAREERRAALVKLQGEEACEGLPRFLGAVRTLASDRRLSRYMYLASRSSALDA
jgi:hypothetical protein